MHQAATPNTEAMAISSDKRTFFAQLGGRFTDLHKAQDITQTQMAEHLGVSQQKVNSYEVERRRVPVSTLPAPVRLLDVTVEELIGAAPKPVKRRPVPKIQQLERITRLPKTQQRVVMQMLDGVLAQASR